MDNIHMEVPPHEQTDRRLWKHYLPEIHLQAVMNSASVDDWTDKSLLVMNQEISWHDNIPATGGPIQKATPWNIASKPNAFVSFSSPSSSTRAMGRSDTHTPGKHKKTCVQVYEAVSVLAKAILNTFELSFNTAFFCQICSIRSIWQKQPSMVIHGTGDCLKHRLDRKVSDLSGTVSYSQS